MAEKLNYMFGKVVNAVGKNENASCSRTLKQGLCGKGLKCIQIQIIQYKSIEVIANITKCHYRYYVNPLADDKILDWSKLKQIADDILKCI